MRLLLLSPHALLKPPSDEGGGSPQGEAEGENAAKQNLSPSRAQTRDSPLVRGGCFFIVRISFSAT